MTRAGVGGARARHCGPLPPRHALSQCLQHAEFAAQLACRGHHSMLTSAHPAVPSPDSYTTSTPPGYSRFNTALTSSSR